MKQIVMVMPNRPGVVAEISSATGDAGVNIEAIEAEVIGEMGVVRLSVSDYDAAMRALHEAGFHPLSQEVFLVRLEDAPGSLAQVARRFKDADIDIQSLRLVSHDGKQAIAAISCDSTEEARALVKDELVS